MEAIARACEAVAHVRVDGVPVEVHHDVVMHPRVVRLYDEDAIRGAAQQHVLVDLAGGEAPDLQSLVLLVDALEPHVRDDVARHQTVGLRHADLRAVPAGALDARVGERDAFEEVRLVDDRAPVALDAVAVRLGAPDVEALTARVVHEEVV